MKTKEKTFDDMLRYYRYEDNQLTDNQKKIFDRHREEFDHLVKHSDRRIKINHAKSRLKNDVRDIPGGVINR